MVDPLTLNGFAAGLDVVTYEFENVPVASAVHLARTHPVYPPPRALAVSQHRVEEKQFLRDLGIPTANWRSVDSFMGLQAAFAEFGPVVVKTVRHGYDGRGQVVVRGAAELRNAWDTLQGRELIAEQLVAFHRELSIVSVRSIGGEVAHYPLVANVHSDGILRSTSAPAGISGALEEMAQDFAARVVGELQYVGVVAIELFQVGDALLANEIAPRVHNSGHWTMDGAVTSQFENHLRAITGLPLGSTAPRGFTRMTNLIGELPPQHLLAALPDVHIHLYGKSPRPGRKLGHVNVVHSSQTAADEADRRLREIVDRVPQEAGNQWPLSAPTGGGVG
jgi:5-(carboxyamino)imidazole ribonucleotide synthase